jgi:toxin ParE1/3/4
LKGYRLTPSAERDLVEIAEFVAREAGPRLANRVLDEISAAMDRIAEAPRIGRLRLDRSRRPVRSWRCYDYLIVYRTDFVPLAVLRIWHGARSSRRLADAIEDAYDE